MEPRDEMQRSAPIFAEPQFAFFALIFLGGQAGFSTAAMARSPELARLFQQPDLENHWGPMRNRALPSVMAFVAQATHPGGCSLTRPPSCCVTRPRAWSRTSILNRFASLLAGADAERQSQLRRLESPAFGRGPSPSAAWVLHQFTPLRRQIIKNSV